MKTQKVLLKDIELNEDRAEGGKGDIESLARNMEKYGQINAVTVVETPTGSSAYRIVAGRRRIAAAASLGWTEIRADVYAAGEIGEDSEEMIALSENAAREEMNAIDEGILYANELKKGTPVEELAALFCRSKSGVYQRAKLASLIPELRTFFKNKRLSLHLAAMAASLPEEAQRKIVEAYNGNDYEVGEWRIKNLINDLNSDYVENLNGCPECAACSKRTKFSDETLFPELDQPEDRCFDHACFCKKYAAMLDAAFSEFREREKGTSEMEAWDGKRIIATTDVPEGSNVTGIPLGAIADDEQELFDNDEDDAAIKSKLEADNKVSHVPCWNGKEFKFVELVNSEDYDKLYYDGDVCADSDWKKKERNELCEIFQSLGKDKLDEILAVQSAWRLETDVKNAYVSKIADALSPENCDAQDLLALAAMLALPKPDALKFLADEGVSKNDASLSYAMFKKLQAIPAKSLCLALIKSKLFGYGFQPKTTGLDGSDEWEKIFKTFGITLKDLRDEAAQEVAEEELSNGGDKQNEQAAENADEDGDSGDDDGTDEEWSDNGIIYEGDEE